MQDDDVPLALVDRAHGGPVGPVILERVVGERGHGRRRSAAAGVRPGTESASASTMNGEVVDVREAIADEQNRSPVASGELRFRGRVGAEAAEECRRARAIRPRRVIMRRMSACPAELPNEHERDAGVTSRVTES